MITAKGVIAIYYGLERPFHPSIYDLNKEIPLCLDFKGKDGEIYVICPELKKPLLVMDINNFDKYWSPIVDTSFIFEEDSIKIEVKGEDPYIESLFPIDFIDNNDLMLKIYITFPKKTEIRVFYGKPCQPYTFQESYGYPLQIGSNMVNLVIPFDDSIERIRLDPVDTMIDCSIKKIESILLIDSLISFDIYLYTFLEWLI